MRCPSGASPRWPSASPYATWAPGPPHQPLCDGAIDVWRADLTAASDKLCATLNDDERTRAGRIVREHDRMLWMRARGLLRALLGSYLDREPSTLRFTHGDRGKPAMLDNAAQGPLAWRARPSSPDMGLQFNLSHSGGIAVYAFSAEVPVGIDVEVARRPINELAIAERTFGTAAAERLRKLDADARRQEFLRAWVRHEARLKCLGVGIGAADDTVAQRSRSLQGGQEPWIAELDIGPRGAAAVAADTPPRELRCWLWPATAEP